MKFIVQISSKCRKCKNFADIISGSSLLEIWKAHIGTGCLFHKTRPDPQTACSLRTNVSRRLCHVLLRSCEKSSTQHCVIRNGTYHLLLSKIDLGAIFFIPFSRNHYGHVRRTSSPGRPIFARARVRVIKTPLYLVSASQRRSCRG